MNLLDFGVMYPNLPGFKEATTSRDAAVSMARTSGYLRRRVLDALAEGDATADELAARCGETVLAIRPRCSELVEMKLVRDTGRRRPNASGRMAKVLTLTGDDI